MAKIYSFYFGRSEVSAILFFMLSVGVESQKLSDPIGVPNLNLDKNLEVSLF